DSGNQRRKSIIVSAHILNYLANCRHVVVFEAAAQRVSQHLLRHDADENIFLLHEFLTQTDHAIERSTVEKRSAGIHLAGLIVRSPVSHCVEVLESKTN